MLIILFTLFILPVCLCDKSAVNRCFCKLQELVDDCNSSITKLEAYNNQNIYPLLKSILSKDYFRYFKVNLNKKCPFWVDDSQCALRDCHVKGCGPSDIPKGLKEIDPEYIKQQKSKYVGTPELIHHPECIDENHGGLGTLDTSISDNQKEEFQNWMKFDDQQDNFCEIDDETSNGSTFVDLTINPERYTGYQGKSAHRIWNSIYKENCFNENQNDFGIKIKSGAADRSTCLEKRIFYRIISGLHTSISIHLSHQYLLKDATASVFSKPKWGPNVTEFKRRFDSKHDKDGPQRLKNLFFTYLVELRALSKVADYLKEERFYTGDPQSDVETGEAVRLLLDYAKKYPDPFDESKLFQGDVHEASKLKYQFKQRFRNISRIMDCVGCDKCKLWGKLQTTGMGTALKILFSDNLPSPNSSGSDYFSNNSIPVDSVDTLFMLNKPITKKRFYLTRTEIVAFLNAFGRLSNSIHSLTDFRELLNSM